MRMVCAVPNAALAALMAGGRVCVPAMKPDELSFHRRWLTLMDAVDAARIGDCWPVKACSPPTGHLSKKPDRRATEA